MYTQAAYYKWNEHFKKSLKIENGIKQWFWKYHGFMDFSILSAGNNSDVRHPLSSKHVYRTNPKQYSCWARSQN